MTENTLPLQGELQIEPVPLVSPQDQHEAAFPYAKSEYKHLIRYNQSLLAGATATILFSESGGDFILVSWATLANALQFKIDENPYLWADITKPNIFTFPRIGNKLEIINTSAVTIVLTVITYSGEVAFNGS